jgi:hypothetical protein
VVCSHNPQVGVGGSIVKGQAASYEFAKEGMKCLRRDECPVMLGKTCVFARAGLITVLNKRCRGSSTDCVAVGERTHRSELVGTWSGAGVHRCERCNYLFWAMASCSDAAGVENGGSVVYLASTFGSRGHVTRAKGRLIT